MAKQFEDSVISEALKRLGRVIDSGALADDGLTSLADEDTQQPLAWVDANGEVWPHEYGAQIHFGIRYLYTGQELAEAIRMRDAIYVPPEVNTMSSRSVPFVTGEAEIPPEPALTQKDIAASALQRSQALAAFASPVSSK